MKQFTVSAVLEANYGRLMGLGLDELKTEAVALVTATAGRGTSATVAKRFGIAVRRAPSLTVARATVTNYLLAGDGLKVV